jgi:hypothetical protein
MPRNTAPRVDAADRDARALELRRAGLSYRQIAAQMSVSVGAAWKYVTRGLDRTRREPADALRDLEAERLDQLQLEALRVLRRRHFLVQGGEVVTRTNPGTGQVEELLDDGPVLAAIRALLAVQERRARLLGLDAPAKVDASVTLRGAWEHAGREERLGLIDLAIVDLEAELSQQGPPTPPSAETIAAPSGLEPDPETLAAAVEAALDAAGVPPDRREAAYQAVEQQLQERIR